MNFLKIAKDFKFLPKWRNFAKSGHTGCKEITFVLNQKFISLLYLSTCEHITGIGQQNT